MGKCKRGSEMGKCKRGDQSMVSGALVARIPQVDGGIRVVYAGTPRAARDAREWIRRDGLCVIDHILGLSWIEYAAGGQVTDSGRRAR